MPIRIVLMRVMLWSLGFAAVAGVLAILLQTGALLWRVIGTGVVTAAACAILLPISSVIDRNSMRRSGLVGMAGVIAEFLMALMLIWDAPRRLSGIVAEDRIFYSMMFLAVAVVLLMVFLKVLREPRYVIAGRFGVIMTLAAFVMFMIGVWGPLVSSGGLAYAHQYFGKYLDSGGVILLFGLLVVLCLIGIGTGERRHWRWLGVSGATAAWALWLLDIWIGSGSDLGLVIFSACTAMAAVTGLANLLLLCSLNAGQTWLRSATIGSAVLTAGFIDLLIFSDRMYSIGIDEDILGRMAGAMGIIAGCGTLALCVLARINRNVDLDPVTAEMLEMTVVCPRCNKKQQIPVGKGKCSSCKLRISIRIEEPRCPTCDYLLYRLTSDRCPECGTRIGEEPISAIA